MNKIVGDYDEFCSSMLEAAEEDNLPVGLQADDTSAFTLQDIHDLIQNFTTDTGLDMTVHLFNCNNCGTLHALFEVNYFDEEEEDGDTLLQ